MNKIYIKISQSTLWILDYNFVCAIFFIPITTYSSFKLRKRKKDKNEKRRLKELQKLKELQRLFRVIQVASPELSWSLFITIIKLRGGELESWVVPGVDNCINLKGPSYINDERIIRFLKQKFSNLAIKGIVYITKEALCYLVENEGVVDFPVQLLQIIKIDGVYKFAKVVVEWTIVSMGTALLVGGVLSPIQTIVNFGLIWLFVHTRKILQPTISEVRTFNQFTGEYASEYVPRIDSRMDAIVFDAKQEPLPPVIQKSVKSVRIISLDKEYEITEKNLVDISKVSKLKNKFSDRIFTGVKSRKKKKSAKMVYLSDMIKKWQNDDTNDEGINLIDEGINTIEEMIRDGRINL